MNEIEFLETSLFFLVTVGAFFILYIFDIFWEFLSAVTIGETLSDLQLTNHKKWA
jgi:hypothetical protein